MALDPGITQNGSGYDAIEWSIFGQQYFLKAICESSFAFEANSLPGQSVPVHVHPSQDEFILVHSGELDLKLDGTWCKARAGDLVRMPRGVPHGYFNKSNSPVKALFWVSPAGRLRELFDALHQLEDVEEAIRLSAAHDVDFLPPEANAE